MKSISTAAAALCVLAGPAFAQDSVSVKMPSWMWAEGPVGEWFDSNVASFEAANPGVTVEKTLIPAADFEQTVTTQIAGGETPDLLPVFTSMLAPMIDAGILGPMDECIASAGFGDRMLPSVSFAQVDGKTYGVPLTMSPWSFIVNTKLLEEAGVGIPTTLDEFYAAALAVKEKTGAFGYAFPNDTSAAIHVYINSMQWVIGMGSDWSQADGTITANAPANIEAISWIKRFMDEDLSPIGLGIVQGRELFADGKAAMLFEGPWVMSQLQSSNPELLEHVTYEVMPTPTHAAITGGAFYVIPKDAENKEAACNLLSVFNSVDAQSDWFEGLHQIPGTVVEPSAELLADAPWVGTMGTIAAQYPGGIGYAPPGYEIQAAEFRQIVVDALSRIYSNAVSVEEGLNDLQTQLEAWAKTI